MQKARGTEPQTPRRKAGSFYDRADGSGSGRAAEQTAGSTGTAGRAAPGSAQAGGCGSGICRRLGRSVRCTDAFGLGFVLGFAEDCFCPLCGGCGAGCAAARVWRALAAQCLYAVRTGRCSGSAVDGCQNTAPAALAGCGTLVGVALCFAFGGGGAELVLYSAGRCPAGRSHGLCLRQFAPEKPGAGMLLVGAASGGTGQRAAVAAAAGRDRLRGAGTVFMQQRAGQSRACGLRGAGRCAVRGRPGPQLCGIRPWPVPRRQRRCWHPDGAWKRQPPTRAAA